MTTFNPFQRSVTTSTRKEDGEKPQYKEYFTSSRSRSDRDAHKRLPDPAPAKPKGITLKIGPPSTAVSVGFCEKTLEL